MLLYLFYTGDIQGHRRWCPFYVMSSRKGNNKCGILWSKKELHLIVTAVAGGAVAVHEAEKYLAGGA